MDRDLENQNSIVIYSMCPTVDVRMQTTVWSYCYLIDQIGGQIMIVFVHLSSTVLKPDIMKGHTTIYTRLKDITSGSMPERKYLINTITYRYLYKTLSIFLMCGCELTK